MEDFAALEPLAGGWSGETFLARAGSERSVVRIFAAPHHAAAAADIQAALLHLLRGLVPVPAVLEVRPASAGMPAMLVTEYLEGERGDDALAGLGPDGRRAVGEELGRIAATFAGIPQPVAGRFVDAELRIEPWEPGGLPEWVEAHRSELRGIEVDALVEVAGGAQRLLDTVERVTLVHSDLNPKNVLLSGTAVAGVLDLEFAHAGHPFTDLGNLLRFDRAPEYVDGVLAGWTLLRGGDPADALDLARAADLFALVDLAARHGADPVSARAYGHLAAIAEAGDWHAAPAT